MGAVFPEPAVPVRARRPVFPAVEVVPRAAREGDRGEPAVLPAVSVALPVVSPDLAVRVALAAVPVALVVPPAVSEVLADRVGVFPVLEVVGQVAKAGARVDSVALPAVSEVLAVPAVRVALASREEPAGTTTRRPRSGGQNRPSRSRICAYNW